MLDEKIKNQLSAIIKNKSSIYLSISYLADFNYAEEVETFLNDKISVVKWDPISRATHNLDRIKKCEALIMVPPKKYTTTVKDYTFGSICLGKGQVSEIETTSKTTYLLLGAQIIAVKGITGIKNESDWASYRFFSHKNIVLVDNTLGELYIKPLNFNESFEKSLLTRHIGCFEYASFKKTTSDTISRPELTRTIKLMLATAKHLV